MRKWTVAGALIENTDGLLLVRNDRPTGVTDWSTPGGVIDEADASVLDGLAREVQEETGLRVEAWDGLVYSVHAEAPDMGWHMRCEVHLVAEYSGEFAFTDPDGIVVDAAFVPREECAEHLAAARPWVREPLVAWLTVPWALGTVREFHYRVTGSSPADLHIARIAP